MHTSKAGESYDILQNHTRCLCVWNVSLPTVSYVTHANDHLLHENRTCIHHWTIENTLQCLRWTFCNMTTVEVCLDRHVPVTLLQINKSLCWHIPDILVLTYVAEYVQTAAADFTVCQSWTSLLFSHLEFGGRMLIVLLLLGVKHHYVQLLPICIAVFWNYYADPQRLTTWPFSNHSNWTKEIYTHFCLQCFPTLYLIEKLMFRHTSDALVYECYIVIRMSITPKYAHELTRSKLTLFFKVFSIFLISVYIACVCVPN